MAKGAFKNNKFRGYYEGKDLHSYTSNMKSVLDYNNTNTVEERIEKVNELLSLGKYGSEDEFWMEVWDAGICKSGLNTSDGLWSETNVCEMLTTLGTYILAKAPKDKGEKIITYDDYKLFKRMIEEKEKINPACDNDGDGLMVYKKKDNYKLAPKYESNLFDSNVTLEINGVKITTESALKDKIIDFKLEGSYTITYKKNYNNKEYKKDVTLNILDCKNFKSNDILYNFPIKELNYNSELIFDIEDELYIPKIKDTVYGEKLENEIKNRIGYLNKCKVINKDSDLNKYEHIRGYYELLRLFNSMTCSNSNVYRTISDKIRKDYCKYLNDGKFKDCKNKITDSKLYSTCKNNLPLLKDDMLMYKESKERPIVFKCPLKDSGNEIDWSYLDMFDPKHVKALLQVRRDIDICEDALIDLEDLMNNIELDEELEEILTLWKMDKTVVYIADRMEVDEKTIRRKIDKIVNKIITEYEKQYSEEYYYMSVVKGEYKKCSKCGEIKLTKYFDKNGSKGYKSMCKECRK